MGLGESLSLALKNLTANKLRSLLTILGVIIGVASVISLVSIGQGVKTYIDQEIQALGSDLIIVLPGQQKGLTGGTVGGTLSTLTYEDARALETESVAIGKVAPILEAGGQIKFDGKVHNTIVNGTNANYSAVRNHRILKGRFLQTMDITERKTVVVLGSTAKKKLFGNADATGKSIFLNNVKFTVIGVMEAKGVSLTIDNDDRIFIPVTSAQELLSSQNLSLIFAQAKSSTLIATAVEDSKEILKNKHKKSDFSVNAQQDILSAFSNITKTLTGMLAGIAGVSLIVGGIGIMNIMLVSVSERTREIGIRKAVGAKDSDILFQFLAESIVLSLLGGLIGIGMGLLGAEILSSLIPNLTTVVTLNSVIIALTFSFLVGLFFGIYPARRAARLNPIEALRYE